MSAAENKETCQFQTEVDQLLDLMIHSLYSNKEIFLRELISNASDAADKLRFEALSDDSLYEGDSELKIRVAFDKEARTVTVSDNGIGMTRDEVAANIGTIAKSGTKEFAKALSGDQAQDANLIGQFGVGFYSSFIVADKVTLSTRKAGTTADQGVEWESEGKGSYSIQNIDRQAHGTSVTLHLREDEDEFLNDFRLESIIRKFSDHVCFPIVMLKQPPAPPPEMDDQGNIVGEAPEAPPPADETINSASALWTLSKSEIKEEEYEEFYKHVAHDFEGPLTHVHARLEGNYDYSVLLYIPKRAPFDLWDRDRKQGVKLYVKRVFIMEGSEELMPRYLRFVRGVIDSADLPLNVSREILQQDKVLKAIKKGAVGKVLGLLETMAKKEKEKYAEFWKTFGVVIKEGVVEDYENKEKLAKLLRFATTHDDSETQAHSLADYVGRMKEGQEKIYYITGETFTAAKHSPHLEVFRKKGIEVLLLTDRVDEWLADNLGEFDGKKLQSAAKGALDLGDLDDEEEKKKLDETAEDFKDLIEKVQKSLEEQVKEVRVTNRLTDSPACLVVEADGMSQQMERLLKQAGQDLGMMGGSKPILELNPDHPLVGRLKGEGDEDRFGDLSLVLFEQAMLSEGGKLEDPAGFVRRLNGLMLDLSK